MPRLLSGSNLSGRDNLRCRAPQDYLVQAPHDRAARPHSKQERCCSVGPGRCRLRLPRRGFGWRGLSCGMRCAVGKRGSAACWSAPVKGGAHRGWTTGQPVPTLSGGEYPGRAVYTTRAWGPPAAAGVEWTANGVRLDQPLQGAGVPGSPLQGQTLVTEGPHPGTCLGVPSKD